MRDIGNALNEIMRNENCSPICAFFLFTQEEGDKNGIYKLQSESSEKVSRRLCHTGDFKKSK